MLQNNWLRQAAVAIGKKAIAKIFAGLLLRYRHSSQSSDNFQFLENFPEDMKGIFSSCKLNGSYNYSSSSGNGASGAVPGSESEYDYTDVDVHINFYYYNTDLIFSSTLRNETLASLSLAEYDSKQADAVYLRFNINSYIIPSKVSGVERVFRINMKKVETIDFYGLKLSSPTTMTFICPALKRIRLCQVLYDKIKDSIPKGVEVYINDL